LQKNLKFIQLCIFLVYVHLVQVTYTITLPQMHVGTLLGSRGSNVNAIRNRSGAKIKVHENRPGLNERQVDVTGDTSQASGS